MDRPHVGTACIIRADSRALPLADSSVDLVVTSPPYFGLRSYQDGGEHYAEQIGAEPTPAEFIAALLEVTAECMRVLKPSGSIFVNLGDKYGPDKSLLGIPWDYALSARKQLGLILRAEIIWDKPNGLPESVTDRVRRSHETWFHFTVQPRYYSAIDNIREGYAPGTAARYAAGYNERAVDNARPTVNTKLGGDTYDTNPLGKLPGSVWTIPTQPLKVPAHLGVDHFAAFPMEWPRRIIRGFSPAEVCSACGEGRRPVVASVGLDLTRKQAARAHELATAGGLTEAHYAALLSVGVSDTGRGAATQKGTGRNTPEVYALAAEARGVLGGYAREYLLRRPTSFTQACACPDITALSTPGVVLDPFGGTGTTALVAKALGRDGISVDMSADYCRLAEWRTTDPGELARAMQVEKPAPELEGQADLFGDVA